MSSPPDPVSSIAKHSSPPSPSEYGGTLALSRLRNVISRLAVSRKKQSVLDAQMSRVLPAVFWTLPEQIAVEFLRCIGV